MEGGIGVVSVLFTLVSTELYDKCELCRHCPGYLPPPNGVDDGLANYTVLGSDLPGCTICDDVCDDSNITAYSNGLGMTDGHVRALDLSNVVSIDMKYYN